MWWELRTRFQIEANLPYQASHGVIPVQFGYTANIFSNVRILVKKLNVVLVDGPLGKRCFGSITVLLYLSETEPMFGGYRAIVSIRNRSYSGQRRAVGSHRGAIPTRMIFGKDAELGVFEESNSQGGDQGKDAHFQNVTGMK